jgi:deazaflavin-dependent oxidoreductase (nitroreductase family)
VYAQLQIATGNLLMEVRRTPMDEDIRRALSHGQTIDITTNGRQSGLPRRIEIVFHNFDGRIYISGMPSRRKRSWLANLEADPRFTFHLKGKRVTADLPATARVIGDQAERQAIMPKVAAVWRRQDVDEMIANSPLVEVTVEEIAAA